MISSRAIAPAISALLLSLIACGDAPPAQEGPGTPAASTGASEPPSGGSSSTGDVSDLLSATVIRWRVVGDYSGDELILNAGTNGYAPVTDHVELTFDYTSEGNGGLTGTPTVTNFPSVVGALRNGAVGCRAPTMSGAYEHSTITELKDGFGGQLTMVVRTDYPSGQVPVACNGGNQPSPARSPTTETDLIVPSVGLLTMGDQLKGDEMRVAPDKRSLIIKHDGWAYTYTPSTVR
jgi:hypothetical protein